MATLSAPVLDLELAFNTNSFPATVTGQHKTGESLTGGGGMAPSINPGPTSPSIAAPVQSFGIDNLPGGISGTATATPLSAPVQTFGLTNLAPVVGYDVWAIDGAQMGANTGEIATHRLLTLSFRVQTQTLLDNLRAAKSDEGQVDVLGTDSGGYNAVDRANGGNTFKLDPPLARRPLRQIGNYHVERYEESLVSQDVTEWDVELEFAPDANRSDTRSVDDKYLRGAAFDMVFDATFEQTEWGLTTRYGTIATDRVNAEFLGTGADGVERFELTTRLTYQQALAFEAALSKLEGVRVRAIPDATNVAVDDTGGDNTLTVDPPTAGDEVPSGGYVVWEWESRRLNDSFQEVSLTIADKG